MPRFQGRRIWLFTGLAVAFWLAAAAPECQRISPEIESPADTPGPPVWTPALGTETGTADLSVWVPDGWSGPIKIDEASSELRVAWANRGSAMAEDYSIVLKADGDIIYRWNKPLLAPGSERVEVIALKDLVDPYLLIRGRHHLEFILDPDAELPDQDRENNSFSLEREFRFQLPDLRLSTPTDANWEGPLVIGGSDLVYGRIDGAPERGYFLAFGVANVGAKGDQALSQRYSVQLNNHSIKRSEFLPASDSAPLPGDVQIRAVPIWRLTVLGQPLLLGHHQIMITIDETNQFIEADEQNNILTGLVRLPPSRARSVRDQTDTQEVTVHPVYVVPAGTSDEQWDINGTIEGIVADLQVWLRERTDGRGIVWDEAGGSLDITFIRLVQSEAELAKQRNGWEPIAEELYRRGLDDPSKIYAVWYPFVRWDAETLICGVQTVYRSVNFAFSFFQRVDGGLNRCTDQPVTMVHELFHAFGAVAPCAANYYAGPGTIRQYHVDDDPNDLLYDGDLVGYPSELDKGHDDYFGHDIPGCVDAADSPYLEPQK